MSSDTTCGSENRLHYYGTGVQSSIVHQYYELHYDPYSPKVPKSPRKSEYISFLYALFFMFFRRFFFSFFIINLSPGFPW